LYFVQSSILVEKKESEMKFCYFLPDKDSEERIDVIRRTIMVNFESLANELLFDLFEFFNTVDLIVAFFGLNSRLNKLISTHFSSHQFNLQSISKDNFDIICDQHLSLLVDKISSFCLSNEETPNLTELILSQCFTLDRFSRLKSITLHSIYSLDTLTKITYQCRFVPYLTHLKIINHEDGQNLIRIVVLFDNIWQIPNLTHCNLNGIRKSFTVFPRMLSTSSCMKYLFLNNIECNFQFVSNLLMCTPHLEHLSTTIRSHSENEHFECTYSSIHSMKNLLEKMPNLYKLKIETSNLFWDGNEWKEMITNCLPKIELFRFQMKFILEFQLNKEEHINEMLNTFKSDYWLLKHQWFVRYQWNPYDPSNLVTFYTLPYAFNTIHYSNNHRSKSTCRDQQEYRSYDCVKSLDMSETKSSASHNLSLFTSHFRKVDHLRINIPFDDNFLFRFLSLNILTSVELIFSTDSVYDQLQILVDQTPRLYSLKLISCKTLDRTLFHLTSQSIDRLHIKESSSNGSNSVNDDDCNKLINCPLGVRCQVLLIDILNRSDVIHIIRNMSNLRLLIFKCQSDEKFFRNFSTNDEPIEWLRNNLSSASSIIRDRLDPSYIHIWISRQKQIFNNDIFIPKDRFKNFRLLKSNLTALLRKS
jgi:hypothetical protein